MHICYLPNIAYFQTLLKQEKFEFHVNDFYSRQTYRNRTEIVGPNGKLILSIPIQKIELGARKYENIKISYSESWLKQHWKSFESAYRRSAYFEYYEDKLKPFYEKPSYEHLWEFNFELTKVLIGLLKLDNSVILNKSVEIEKDLNYQLITNLKYTQVFNNKLEFVENLSVIDLIFNTGPQSKMYLL